MALVYVNNDLTWDGVRDQWSLVMQVALGQKGVSNNPFVVERFINKDDLQNADGSLKALEDIKAELNNSEKYLFRRVATASDLSDIPTKDELSSDLLSKQDSRTEDLLEHDGTVSPLTIDNQDYTFENYSYPDPTTAANHYDHIPVAGYYKYRVSTITAMYSTYDLGFTIQKANDTYLRVYAGEFLEDSSLEHQPLSVGIAGVYPSRTFTPGSLQASDLVAGDSIYLNVSGGSGDYEAVVSDESLLYTLNATRRYRVVSNIDSNATITISDSKTNESKVVELTVVRKGD